MNCFYKNIQQNNKHEMGKTGKTKKVSDIGGTAEKELPAKSEVIKWN